MIRVYNGSVVLNPIAVAVPFFFVLIGAELAWAKKKKVSVYRFADSITDLSCGIASQIEAALLGTTILAIYTLVYAHRLFTIERPVWQWVIAFFTVDFVYYWWHRASHEVNFMWAAHVVHHQSEDYNLAVALRQAWFTSVTDWPFYLPMAFLGVNLEIFLLSNAVSLLYEFWIHTELIRRIDPLEYVLNTPAHHRVHHATNPEYLDKNYGATLIVWDHLFGTFEDEVEPPIYGLTTPLGSFNPLWAQVHYFWDMQKLWSTSVGAEKLGAIFRSPAWKPKAYVHPPARSLAKETYVKYSVYTPKKTQTYVLVNYVVVAAATFVVMGFGESLPRSVLYLGCASIVLALLSLGGLLEMKKWAPAIEAARLMIGAFAIALYVLPKLGLHL